MHGRDAILCEANPQARCLLEPSLLRVRHKPDLAHTCTLRRSHGGGYLLIAHCLVAADVQVGLGICSNGVSVRVALLVVG